MGSWKDAAIPSLTPTHTVPDLLSAALNQTTFSIMYLCAHTVATDFFVLEHEGEIKNLMKHHHEEQDRFLTSVL